MSKDIISIDKCKACHALGNSCCNTQPVFTNSELAKVYYETDVFVDKNIKIIPVANNNFITTLQEWHEDDASTFDINSKECLFLKDGACSIYEYRPAICRDFGETDNLPCYAKEFSIEELNNMEKSVLDTYVQKANEKISKVKMDLLNNDAILNTVFNTTLKNFDTVIPQKDIKEHKLNMITYFIMHNIEFVDYTELIYKDLLHMEHRYELVTTSDNNGIKRINAIRNNVLTSNDPYYKPFTYVHKKIHKYLMSKPYAYHKNLVDDINGLLRTLESRPISDTLSNRLFYKDEFERQSLVNLTITLMAIYALIDLPKPIKYVNKYISNLNDHKTLRFMIYTNIKTLVHGLDNNIFIDDNKFIDIKELSLFKIKLSDDTEKELFDHLSVIVTERIELLVKNLKR